MDVNQVGAWRREASLEEWEPRAGRRRAAPASPAGSAPPRERCSRPSPSGVGGRPWPSPPVGPSARLARDPTPARLRRRSTNPVPRL